MPECVVICRTCRTANGRNPKRWEWLCDACAEDCAAQHRRQTGHEVELRITTDDRPFGRALRDIERYHQMKGMTWIPRSTC